MLSEARAAGRVPGRQRAVPARAGRATSRTAASSPYDPEAARALSRRSTGGSGPLAITLKTTTDPFNLTTAELLKEMWEEVGFEVTLDQIPQGEFIGQALAGNFQVFTLAQPPRRRPRPAVGVVELADDRPGLALNFGRIIDPEVDRLLDEIRTATDEAAREAAAEDLNRYIDEQVFNVWNYWVHWAMAHRRPTSTTPGTLHIPGRARAT